MISVAIRHSRHTLKGIEQNRAFSVNLPSAAQVKETDYCGTVSGAKADKAGDCRFQVLMASWPMLRSSMSAPSTWSAASSRSSTWAATASSSARSPRHTCPSTV